MHFMSNILLLKSCDFRHKEKEYSYAVSNLRAVGIILIECYWPIEDPCFTAHLLYAIKR